MRRPAVLHGVRDWVRPSEGFVADIVTTTSATRAVVACETRWPSAPVTAQIPVYEVGRLVSHVPATQQRRIRAAAVAAIAVRQHASVLHAHFGYWAQPIGAAARRLGRPWVVSLHGHDLLVQAPDDPALGCVREADIVITPSQFLADAAVAFGVPADRIRVVPSGIDLARHVFRERAPDPDGAVTVTFAGRFVEKKGVLDAVRALGAVREAHPGLRALFVGHGPLEDALRAELAAAGLPAEVRDGAAPGAVRLALAETQLLITPSRTAPDGDAETLGLVNVEALACGIPVLTTRHGGIPEAVTSECAVLVPEGDVGALTRGLTGLLEHPERWGAMGRAGRAHVAAGFELGSRVADLEEIYLALAAGGRPGPVRRRAQRRVAPSISVVLVTHNRGDLVRRALDALAAQTYPTDRLEVVVIDNGCTDGTTEALAARTDPMRVTVLREETNSPVVAARNRAVAASTGELVAFTDDDCRPTPTWVECLAAGFVEGVGLVQGRTTADPEQAVRPLSRTQWTPAEFGLYETCNVAYRREFLEAQGADGPFDSGFADEVARSLGQRFGRYPFGEDTELAWRVKRTGVASRFAHGAVVHHHVFPPDVPYLLRRSLLVAGFPLVIREVPELRSRFLWHRVLLGPMRARFLLATAGLVVGVTLSPYALLAGTPYVWRLFDPTRGGRVARAKAAPVVVLRDVLETFALLYGSARTRRLVL